MAIELSTYEAWLVTGSQHLYGEQTLNEVAAHAREIASFLSDSGSVRIVCKPVATTPEAIRRVALEANSSDSCVGLIFWMHTFSPAKMWIPGLAVLQKPFVHLHTQFNREIPWKTIDMDFMNLNQSAHGGREFGFIGARMRRERKVIVGHWRDERVLAQLSGWLRVACAWQDGQGAKIARFGDNMREVAVTEGNKVGAQIQFGYSVNGYPVDELTTRIKAIEGTKVDHLVAEYDELYTVAEPLRRGGAQREALRDAAAIELALRSFLEEGGFKGYTDTFENLGGLPQLPGIPTQRLMADGYGFGAEGDWKTAALLRAMKVMAHGLPGGTSFMEDYTYHFDPVQAKVLGAHMLEVCPSIAASKPTLEIHPLSIGGKSDPVRLVFTAPAGFALNASIIDLGNRFRMIVNEVDVVEPDEPLPKLPVARALWAPRPNLQVAAAGWIHAGGAHHTVFSQTVTTEMLEDFAEIAGIELIVIDAETRLRELKERLRWNEAYYHLFASI